MRSDIICLSSILDTLSNGCDTKPFFTKFPPNRKDRRPGCHRRVVRAGPDVEHHCWWRAAVINSAERATPAGWL